MSAKRLPPTKVCPHCGSDDTHVMSKFCSCGYQFYKWRKRKIKDKLRVNWEDLKPGDKIRLVCNDYWEAPNGEDVVDVGNTGNYTVIEKTKRGLHLYNKYGHVFQDMLATGKNPINGIMRNIPEIRRLKQSEQRI